MASNYVDDVSFDPEPINRNSSRQPKIAESSTTIYNIKSAKNVVLDGTINDYQLAPKKRNSKKVGILWDILTCPIPPRTSIVHLIAKMRSRFIADGYEENIFTCLCDLKNESETTLKDLDASKVQYRSAVQKGKIEMVDKLKEGINQFAEGGVSERKLVVISDHINVDDLFTYIKSIKFPEVILVHKDIASKAVLEDTKTDHFMFHELTDGIPDVDNKETKNSSVPNENTRQDRGGDQNHSKVRTERTDKKMTLEDKDYRSSELITSSDDIVTDSQPETGGSTELKFEGDGSNDKSNWKRGKYIGSGYFGKVYEVEDSPLHRNMAVKQVHGSKQDSKKEMDTLRLELNILQALSDPRIVKYYGFCEADGVLSFFMERISGGSLDKYLHDESKNPLNTGCIRNITRQTLEGVSYLHSKRIIHRDIKSGNILMNEIFQIKLADFGLSKVFQEISKASTLGIGTTRWMAPEMTNTSEGYSYKIDIWAIGCMVIEMVTREYPFHDLKEEHRVIIRLMSDSPSPAYALPETCPTVLRDFVTVVLQTDVSKRPTAKELLLSNPFINGIDCGI